MFTKPCRRTAEYLIAMATHFCRYLAAPYVMLMRVWIMTMYFSLSDAAPEDESFFTTSLRLVYTPSRETCGAMHSNTVLDYEWLTGWSVLPRQSLRLSTTNITNQ